MKSNNQFQLKALLVVLTLAVIPLSCNGQFKDLLSKTKSTVLGGGDGEVGLGLKEALNFGVESAVKSLSAKNGYLESPYKILVPEEAQVIISKVKMVPGFQDVEQQLTEKMNEAAELAAKKATPIFIGAIKNLTIADAMNLLMGDKDAATRFLERETRTALYNEFKPVIQSALDEVNARQYWSTVVNAYNSIPLVKKVNPELDDHVANKGLDGLFSLIEKKEEGIRGDASQRTTDLLKNVFAKQDK